MVLVPPSVHLSLASQEDPVGQLGQLDLEDQLHPFHP